MIWIVLIVLAVICAAAILLDGDVKGAFARRGKTNVVWKDLLTCQVQRVREDGRIALYARITNTSDWTVTLPPIPVWLGFTSTFGHPAKGGNGLSAIGLRDTITNRERLASGETVVLPIDTAAAPARPTPLMAEPRKVRLTPEQARTAVEQRAAHRLRMENLAGQVMRAGDVATFMEDDDNAHFFLELRPAGQYPGLGFFGATSWGR